MTIRRIGWNLCFRNRPPTEEEEAEDLARAEYDDITGNFGLEPGSYMNCAPRMSED